MIARLDRAIAVVLVALGVAFVSMAGLDRVASATSVPGCPRRTDAAFNINQIGAQYVVPAPPHGWEFVAVTFDLTEPRTPRFVVANVVEGQVIDVLAATGYEYRNVRLCKSLIPYPTTTTDSETSWPDSTSTAPPTSPPTTQPSSTTGPPTTAPIPTVATTSTSTSTPTMASLPSSVPSTTVDIGTPATSPTSTTVPATPAPTTTLLASPVSTLPNTGSSPNTGVLLLVGLICLGLGAAGLVLSRRP